MLHLTNSFEISLLCLLKELNNIVRKEKYYEPDFPYNIGKDFNLDNVIFEDD